MGIAMTFAGASGPGDLRTLRRGSRGDDGFPGRERHRGYDACRRSRDVGGLQQKSGIAVYRNEEIVYPFVLWQLGRGLMDEETKKLLIYKSIFFVIWSTTMGIILYLWHLWSESLLSIFGLPDHIVYVLIFGSPFLYLAEKARQYLRKKVYEDNE